MKLRLRFGLVGAMILGVMIVAGVCAGKAAEPEAKIKLPDPMTIVSMITIRGGIKN